MNGIQLKVEFISASTRLGSITNPPYESGGYVLRSGEMVRIPIDKPSNIRLWCQNSGTTRITWMGFDL